MKYRRSQTPLFLLVLLGCAIIFFSLALIGGAFAINYLSDFDVDGDGGVEEIVDGQFNYDQYWAGVIFFVTGVLVICSGIYQRSRGLTVTTTIFCIIATHTALFELVLNSYNFQFWNHMHRNKLYWDSKSGYSCETQGSDCVCSKGSTMKETIASNVQCDEISELTALFGSIVGSAIAVSLFSTASIVVIIKCLTWKRIKYINHGGFYPDDMYMSGRPVRSPSFIDLPYAKRGDMPDTGPPYKQTIYRNYPY